MYVWKAAGESRPDGRVLLRIEDHDRQRSRKEYEEAILEDLAWLGFGADGPLVRQSERHLIYKDALDSLRGEGLVYACECSRSDLDGPRYPGTCAGKHLADAPGLSLRIRLGRPSNTSTTCASDRRRSSRPRSAAISSRAIAKATGPISSPRLSTTGTRASISSCEAKICSTRRDGRSSSRGCSDDPTLRDFCITSC